MSDQQPQFELNDELLRREYLDDELSTEERATIEARLAADPAAQRLLHQLRSVSQAVQALPVESLGRDLSEEVVRRAQIAKAAVGAATPARLGSSHDRPSRLDDATPKFSIFRTPRSWAWASLALAAGLLIMIVQSGNEQGNNLPPLAQHNEWFGADQPIDESVDRARREPAGGALPEAAPPASADVNSRSLDKVESPAAPMPAQSVGLLSDIAKEGAPASSSLAISSGERKDDSVKLKAPADSNSIAGAAGGRASMDKLAAAQQDAGSASDASNPSRINAIEGKLNSADRPSQLLVVHVVAKRDAIKNKEFDRLLDKQKIAVDPQPVNEHLLGLSGGFGGGFAKPAESEAAQSRFSEKVAPEKKAADQDTDMVLVEAPATAIVSCLADLHKDSVNYLGIAVEETSEAKGRAAGTTALAKKISDDLSKYSRGSVPQQQKDSRSGVETYYKSLDVQATDGSARVSDFSAGPGAQVTNGVEELDRKRELAANRGRAWRIQTLQANSPQSGEERAGGRYLRRQIDDSGSKVPKSERMIEEGTKAKAENWKVLFVLSPDDAPSAPAANPTK